VIGATVLSAATSPDRYGRTQTITSPEGPESVALVHGVVSLASMDPPRDRHPPRRSKRGPFGGALGRARAPRLPPHRTSTGWQGRGRPWRLILPARTRLPRRGPTRVLDLLDALLLAGGSDVDPRFLRRRGRTRRRRARRPRRDTFEDRASRRRAIEARHADAPPSVAAMQVVNVALGRDACTSTSPRSSATASTAACLGSFTGADHDVRPPGRLARRAQRGGRRSHVTKKSHHHQGVNELGRGLVVHRPAPTSTSLPEGRRAGPTGGSSSAVQWHPEGRRAQPAHRRARGGGGAGGVDGPA